MKIVSAIGGAFDLAEGIIDDVLLTFRTSSTASNFVSASRLSLHDLTSVGKPQSRNLMYASRMSVGSTSEINQLSQNEFDPATFRTAMFANKRKSLSQWDLHNFGLMGDDPVFFKSGNPSRGKPVNLFRTKSSGISKFRKKAKNNGLQVGLNT